MTNESEKELINKIRVCQNKKSLMESAQNHLNDLNAQLKEANEQFKRHSEEWTKAYNAVEDMLFKVKAK